MKIIILIHILGLIASSMSFAIYLKEDNTGWAIVFGILMLVISASIYVQANQ